MQIATLEEAINLTIAKQGFENSEELQRKIYTELEKGNFNIITNDRGARQFVKAHYTKIQSQRQNPAGPSNLVKENTPKHIQEESPFKDFTTLTKYFDSILKQNNKSKEDPIAFQVLYVNLLQKMKEQNKNNSSRNMTLENLILEAANLYNQEKNVSTRKMRSYSFDTPDITREEAVDVASIFMNMEHQLTRVVESFYKYPAFQKQLMNNLILYSYYEHDYSISFEEQIEACKASTSIRRIA